MFKKSTLFVLMCLVAGNMFSQVFSANDLYNYYDNFKETTLKEKRFKHSDLLPLIKSIKEEGVFKVEKIGKSFEGREINMLSIGSGNKTVLAWSQMHGDEPTATMALFDLFNFFSDTTQFVPLKKYLLQNLKLYFIPMLNPDGAERYTRRTALKIDMNRDAVRLQNRESRILKRLQNKLKPMFGFNLHDQGSLYTTGKTFKTATISFLLPAFNRNKDINDIRERGMKVIADMNSKLTAFMPGHIGRYDDEFEPRAFGDNFVKWGTSSVLIESGGWKDDVEKQFVRKMNFIAILTGLYSMASEHYANFSLDDYFAIPENENYLYDVLIRNIKNKIQDSTVVMDFGINQLESTTKEGDVFYRGAITEAGDLSTFFGNDDYCFDSMEVKHGLIYPEEFETVDQVGKLKFTELLSKGFIYVKVKNIDKNIKFSKYPINIVSTNFVINGDVNLGSNANFLIFDNSALRYVFVNGFMFDVKTKVHKIKNGSIF